MKKWKLIDRLLQPLCKAIDKDIAFILPVPSEKTGDIVKVNIGYKNNTVVCVNVECKKSLDITKAVLNAMDSVMKECQIMKKLEKWNFITKQLQPLCRAIDRNIIFLQPITAEATRASDVVEVEIGYKNECVKSVNVECDSLLGIARDVLNEM